MSTLRTQRMREARSRVGGASHMTPLIDVVFLLLMYFLLTARFFGPERSMEVAPPGEMTEVSTSDPYSLPSRPITILVRSVGDGAEDVTIGSDSSLVPSVGSLDGLTSVLLDARGRDMGNDQRFLVRCTPGSRWEHAMRTLHAVRVAGFEKVRLAEPTS